MAVTPEALDLVFFIPLIQNHTEGPFSSALPDSWQDLPARNDNPLFNEPTNGYILCLGAIHNVSFTYHVSHEPTHIHCMKTICNSPMLATDWSQDFPTRNGNPPYCVG